MSPFEKAESLRRAAERVRVASETAAIYATAEIPDPFSPDLAKIPCYPSGLVLRDDARLERVRRGVR